MVLGAAAAFGAWIEGTTAGTAGSDSRTAGATGSDTFLGWPRRIFWSLSRLRTAFLFFVREPEYSQACSTQPHQSIKTCNIDSVPESKKKRTSAAPQKEKE